MIPEGRFIKKEIVLRELEKSNEEVSTRKSMIRKVVLSLGLVNPKESRTLVFDIFEIMLRLSEDGANVADIHSKLTRMHESVSVKSVYYHIERMLSKGIVEKVRGNYRLLGGKNFGTEIKNMYKRETDEILSTVEQILRKLNNEY